jgi:hypothetical protein
MAALRRFRHRLAHRLARWWAAAVLMREVQVGKPFRLKEDDITVDGVFTSVDWEVYKAICKDNATGEQFVVDLKVLVRIVEQAKVHAPWMVKTLW